MRDQPPHDDPPEELGLPGVESVGIDPAGNKIVVFNPRQTRQRWPGVSTFSQSFEKLSAPEKFYEQAIAFLESARLLIEAAGTSGAAGGNITWSQGAVCYYCIHIATELFLKACISAGTGDVPKIHDIKKLMGMYEDLLPQEEFHFQVPLMWLQVVETSFETLLDRSPDQLYRYGVGRDGQGSSMTHQFVPDILFNRVAHYMEVWPRGWRQVAQRG